MPAIETMPSEEQAAQDSRPAQDCSDWLIDVAGVSKKYCRDLRRSLWYGFRDVVDALTLRASSFDRLREYEFWAVEDVSFQLRRGDALGLLGRNGAGKSTLLKLIAGQRALSMGMIRTRGRIVALTELGLGFNPVLTGRENAYVNAAVHGFSRRQCDAIMEDIIEFSGIREFIDAAVQTYSTGMRARLGYSVATHLKPDILVIDEVLAVGDLDFRRKCVRHILRYVRDGGSIILVAHDPYLVQSICNRCIVLDRGKMIFDGSGIDGVNFHFQLGHSSQYTSLADAAERVLGDTVAEARAEAASEKAIGIAATNERTPAAPRPVMPPLKEDEILVVDEVEVVSADGGPLRTGHAAKVIIHCRAKAPTNITWGFTIVTSDLQTAVTSCVKGMEGDCSRVEAGENALTCILPDFPLQPGVYAIRGGVGDAENLTGLSAKGYRDTPHFFTIVAADVSRTANYKVMHSALVDIKVQWIS